jgi:threonine/homoserine/homoserine lactone efflux protein
VAFQWVNPKGWVMAVGASAAYAAVASYPTNMLLIAGIFGFFCLGSSYTWAGLGSFLQRFLHRPKILRAFNIVMALLLVASLYPIFEDAWK